MVKWHGQLENQFAICNWQGLPVLVLLLFANLLFACCLLLIAYCFPGTIAQKKAYKKCNIQK
jgi:hypothetical protein